MDNTTIELLEQKIGYTFRDKSFLERAFTDISLKAHKKTNERLEFLGDSVLNFVMSEHIFRAFDTEPHDMTELRKNSVSKEPLCAACERLGLLCFLETLNESSKQYFSQKKRSDIVEALIGAVYLDSGSLSQTKDFIFSQLSLNASSPRVSYSVLVKEWAEKNSLSLTYEYNQSAKDGEILFVCTLNIQDKALKGEGRTKKEAKESASNNAARHFNLKN